MPLSTKEVNRIVKFLFFGGIIGYFMYSMSESVQQIAENTAQWPPAEKEESVEDAGLKAAAGTTTEATAATAAAQTTAAPATS
jgi:hypothetical protein